MSDLLGTNLAEVGTDCISRQQAIDIAKELTITIEGYEMHNQAVMDYCAEIMRLPPAEPEKRTENARKTHGVCLDAISRQATIEAINKIMPIDIECDGKLLDLVDVRYVLDNMPTAEPKRIKGKWVGADTQCGIACSVCGVAVDDFCHSADYIDLDYEPNFCPNCGAKMEVTK